MKFNKIYLLLLLTFGCRILLYPSISVAQQKVLSKVVIDAGHGGAIPGAVSGRILEKDINLAVALKFGAMISDNYSDVQVIYTRDRDINIGFYERADIANKAGADLFISVHTNAPSSARNTSVKGFETFIMGIDKNDQNLDVAMRENSVIVYEENYQTKYQGFDPQSSESYIIFSLMQYAHQDQSLAFANMVQKHLAASIDSPNRGVKQQGFLLLWYTTMPSVLIELGFITNPDEQRLLTSDQGQRSYATALFNAFSEYKAVMEGRSNFVTVPTAALPNATSAGATPSSGSVQQSPSEPRIFYSIQIAGGSSMLNMNNPPLSRFRGQVTERRIDNTYRYFVGQHAGYAEAQEALRAVREIVSGAFIVGFVDGSPAPLAEVRSME